MTKKENERIERQKADRDSKARIESDRRQERIKVLRKALTSGSLAPKDKESWDTEPLRSLVELVELQRCEIEYLRRFWWICASHGEPRLGYPIADRRRLQIFAGLLLMGDDLRSFTRRSAAKQNPKTWYEFKRRGYNRGGIGEIERQFGLGHYPSSALHAYGPFCLDDIFFGNTVHMWELQSLFGMDSKRFPKKVRGFKKGRERLYDYRDVVKIMHALLSDPAEHAKSVRGKTRRLWPRADLRTRVLNGIAEQISLLCVSREIARAFLNVVRRHLTDSGK